MLAYMPAPWILWVLKQHFYVYWEGLGIPFFHRGSAGGSAYAFLTPAPRELSPAAPGLRGFHEGPGLGSGSFFRWISPA